MQIERLFSVFRTSARGLEAQRIAMGAATENIANATTTRTEEGGAYARKRAVHEAPNLPYQRFSDMLGRFQGKLNQSHQKHFEGPSLRHRLNDVDLGPVTHVENDLQTRMEYDPAHPHADEAGYVHYPDINVVDEMARMMSANRVYEANLSAIQAAKEMIKRTLEI